MKKMTALCLLSLACLAYADPFDKSQRVLSASSQVSAEPLHNLACEQVGNNPIVFFDDVPFQDLTMIGLLKQESNWQALFINKKQELIQVQKGDFLSKEMVQVENVDKQSVQLLRREKSNCQKTSQILLKL
ncbi:pilus assembly protein PilP [Bisgaard Taxon 46]